MNENKPKTFMTHFPVSTLSNETCLFTTGYHKSLTQFFGWGKVWKIEHGEKFDIVCIQFGFDRKIRDVVVFDNHARRQILTLKKGQYCLCGGQAKMYLRSSDDSPNAKRFKQWTFIAYMLQGMFVPTMFDVKKRNKDIEEGIEQEQISELSDNKANYYDNIINEIFGEEIESEYDIKDIDKELERKKLK